MPNVDIRVKSPTPAGGSFYCAHGFVDAWVGFFPASWVMGAHCQDASTCLAAAPDCVLSGLQKQGLPLERSVVATVCACPGCCFQQSAVDFLPTPIILQMRCYDFLVNICCMATLLD